MDVVVRLDACVHHEYRPNGVVLVRPRDQRIWSRNLGVIRYSGLRGDHAQKAAGRWMTENSTNPDTEILNAVRPGLATTFGPLFMISSPYARRGELWNIYNKHFGPSGDPSILVAQGTSRTFNPSLPQSIVDRAMERD